MKRTFIASILGIAASVASSYGDGTIVFSTYISSAVVPNIIWCDTSATPPPGHTVGQAIAAADGFSAELYYGLGSGLSFSQLTPIPSSTTSVGKYFPGTIFGPAVILPGWTSGPVTFGIAVWNGTDASPNNVTWTEPATSIAPAGQPAGYFTPALVQAAYPNGYCASGGGPSPPPPPPIPFNFTADYGKITITGYTGPGGAVAIPSTIYGLPVTCIGDYAFEFAFSMTSVTIPDSVTNIGDWAFAQTGLTGVTIPTRVTSVGDGAFYDNASLTSVTIPNSVTNIGELAFGENPKLGAITVGGQNLFYTSVNGVLFNQSQTTLIQYPGGNAAGSYTVPGSVTSIGDRAFAYCSSLSSVMIPNSVTNIGDLEFYKCASLTAITVGAQNLFYSSVNGVLFNQSQTTLIQYPQRNIATSYTIPDSVTNIEDDAFASSGVINVTIGSGITSIADHTFDSCDNLTGVTFGSRVTSIGIDSFYGCGSLTSVTIPNSVASIGHGAFSYCASLTNVTIPNSVTSIADSAFSECFSLTSVTIPNSVTSIGAGVFEGCSSLTSVTIPNGFTTIATDMFSDCTSLTNVTIPNSVTTIGYGAFSGCSRLTSITIPSSVTSIGYFAFGDCYNLTGVYFMGNAPGSDPEVFYSDDEVTVYYLAGTTGWGPTFAGVPTALWALPTASNVVAATIQDHPLNLAVAKLLALAHGPQGDPLTVTSMSATSTNGGSVVLGQNQITYTPVSGYVGDDRFSYEVDDTTTGGSASAYVLVQVLATNQLSGNMLPLTAISGGYSVSFAGIPGRTYSVQRAPTVSGPWVTIASVTVGSDGIGAFQDTSPLESAAFYRTTYP